MAYFNEDNVTEQMCLEIAKEADKSKAVSKKLVKNVSLKTLKDEKKLCFLFWKWRIFFVLLPTEYL